MLSAFPVFASFPLAANFAANHWSVVVGIGLVFLILQLALSLHLYLKAGRQANLLARLSRSYRQGGRGRGSLRSIPRSFLWLRWVRTAFPARNVTGSSNFTRDDVLNELDTRISSSSAYLLLQRLGVMAPLLGVILTVLGFFWLDVNATEDQTLQGLLLSVTPLVIGVGVGAALALVNQALLYVVGGRIEALRMSARTWFDLVIWSNHGFYSQAATTKAVAAVERFSQALTASADRHTVTADHMEQATSSIQAAAALLRDSIESYHAAIQGIPQALTDVRSAASAGADALQELIPVGKRAVANLDVSVAAFRTTIDRDFAQAANLHSNSSKLLAESIQQIRYTTDSLDASSGELKLAAQSNTAAFQCMDDSLRQQLVPGVQQFFDSVNTLTGQIADWSRTMGVLSENVETMASDVNKLGGGLLPTVNSTCDAIDQRVGKALAEQMKQVDSITHSAHELRSSAQHVSDTTTAMNGVFRETMAALRESIESFGNRAPVNGDIDRLTKALSRATESADAIFALSEQFREMLEQNGGSDVGQGAGLIKSGGRIRSWLSSRPK